MMPFAVMLPRLRDAVEHLAWPPACQRAYLSELGVAPSTDELALEFDDAFRTAQSWFDELGLSASARESLGAIDQLLNRMSARGTEPNVWTWEALDHAVQWADLRRLAVRSLEQLPNEVD